MVRLNRHRMGLWTAGVILLEPGRRQRLGTWVRYPWDGYVLETAIQFLGYFSCELLYEMTEYDTRNVENVRIYTN